MRNRKQKRLKTDKARKKNLISVRVNDDEMEALVRMAQKEDLPVSYFVREGIKLIIQRRLKS